jgi:hypothetical protein
MSDLLTAACSACTAWKADRLNGMYVATCDDCNARALARSPGAWRALQGQSDTEIREAILRVFGEARYRDGRRLVWDWIQRLKAATEQAGKGGAA